MESEQYFISDTNIRLSTLIDEPSTAPVDEPSTVIPVDEPSTAPVDEPSTAPVDEPSTVIPVDEPSTVIPVDEPSTVIPVDEPSTIHPEPGLTCIHPEPGLTSIHPEPGLTCIHPEQDPENKEYYIYRAPDNPYYKFDDVCAEILAKDIQHKYDDINEVELYFKIHFNDFEKAKYGEQILKIMNEGLGEFAETTDRILQDFIAIYFSKPQPDYNTCIKYDIKSAKAGYIDAVGNIRYRLDELDEHELLFKYLVASQQIEYQHRWYNGKQFNPYKIWCNKLDKRTEFREAALWSLAIGYSKEDEREYIVDLFTEYIDENIGADFNELREIFLAANPGFNPEKTPIPFIPKSQKILAGKMAFKRTGECAVCKEESIDVVPISWLCSHMVCCGCHNSVYSSGKCHMCRGEIC